MNARGTRRPHAKRVRSKARKPSRSGGGGKKGGAGCVLIMFALASVPVAPLVYALVIR